MGSYTTARCRGSSVHARVVGHTGTALHRTPSHPANPAPPCRPQRRRHVTPGYWAAGWEVLHSCQPCWPAEPPLRCGNTTGESLGQPPAGTAWRSQATTARTAQPAGDCPTQHGIHNNVHTCTGKQRAEGRGKRTSQRRTSVLARVLPPSLCSCPRNVATEQWRVGRAVTIKLSVTPGQRLALHRSVRSLVQCTGNFVHAGWRGGAKCSNIPR